MTKVLFFHKCRNFAWSGCYGRVTGCAVNQQLAQLWMSAAKLGYRYSSSATSTRTGSQISMFSRRQLIPLVRLLHPDMHAMSSAEVRHSNASCIQDLYSIVDYMDEIHRIHGLNKRNSGDVGAESSGIKASPLQKSYVFNFYASTPVSGKAEVKGIADGTTEAEDKQSRPKAPLRQFKVTVKPPLAFSGLGAGANLTSSQALRAVNKLAGELGELFRLVGEPSPWAASSSVGAKHGSAVENDQDEEEWWDLMGPARGEGSTRRSIRGFDMSAVDSKLFERQIERTSRLRSSEQMSHLEHQRYNAYTYMQKKAQREGWDLALGRSSSSSGGKRDQTAGQSADFNLDSDSELEPAPEPVMRRPARIGSRQAILQAEIDSYLRSPGRVLLRGVPLEEELAVMGRLRDFLLQHGVLLNFCFDNWRMVTMVLTANEEIDDLRAAPHRGRSAGGTKLRRNDRQAYKCTAFSNLDTPSTMANASAGLRHEGNLTTGAVTSSKEFVVEFPQDFRPTMLLDVLLDLPAASVLKRGV